jgi:hypothetical protein
MSARGAFNLTSIICPHGVCGRIKSKGKAGFKHGGPCLRQEARGTGKQKNGMGNPAIENGEAGHNLPSVTTATKQCEVFASAYQNELTTPSI